MAGVYFSISRVIKLEIIEIEIIEKPFLSLKNVLSFLSLQYATLKITRSTSQEASLYFSASCISFVPGTQTHVQEILFFKKNKNTLNTPLFP